MASHLIEPLLLRLQVEGRFQLVNVVQTDPGRTGDGRREEQGVEPGEAADRRAGGHRDTLKIREPRI